MTLDLSPIFPLFESSSRHNIKKKKKARCPTTPDAPTRESPGPQPALLACPVASFGYLGEEMFTES